MTEQPPVFLGEFQLIVIEFLVEFVLTGASNPEAGTQERKEYSDEDRPAPLKSTAVAMNLYSLEGMRPKIEA